MTPLCPGDARRDAGDQVPGSQLWVTPLSLSLSPLPGEGPLCSSQPEPASVSWPASSRGRVRLTWVRTLASDGARVSLSPGLGDLTLPVTC